MFTIVLIINYIVTVLCIHTFVLINIANRYVQSKSMFKGILKVQKYNIYCLENGNVVVNLSTVLLSHTLTNPYNVSAFLFLQLQV